MEYGEITESLNKIHHKIGDKKFALSDVSDIASESDINILKCTGMLAEIDGKFSLTKDGLEMVDDA